MVSYRNGGVVISQFGGLVDIGCRVLIYVNINKRLGEQARFRDLVVRTRSGNSAYLRLTAIVERRDFYALCFEPWRLTMK